MNDRTYPTTGRLSASTMADTPTVAARNLTSILTGTAKRLDEANVLAAKIAERLRGPEPCGGDEKAAYNGTLQVAEDNEAKVSRLLSQLEQIASCIG